jgi:hypothetical protein
MLVLVYEAREAVTSDVVPCIMPDWMAVEYCCIQITWLMKALSRLSSEERHSGPVNRPIMCAGDLVDALVCVCGHQWSMR